MRWIKSERTFVVRQNEEGWRNSPEINIEISEVPDSPELDPDVDTRPKKLLTATKHAWESEDQDEDILDRFLKVKKFADNRVASYESKPINFKSYFLGATRTRSYWKFLASSYATLKFDQSD